MVPVLICVSQFADDPDFPYVGKFIANLTLAQVKTLDCGSLRLIDFREFLAAFRYTESLNKYP